MGRTDFGLVLVVLGFTLAVPASATPPQRTHFSVPGATFPVNELCSFTVTDTLLIAEVEETTYFDAAGRITRVHDLFQIQDSFAANGHTLVGDPYTANAFTYFDSNGNVTNSVAQGVLTRVPLPEGAPFIAAGRVDPFNGGAFVPDYGAFQNGDRFCAALAS